MENRLKLPTGEAASCRFSRMYELILSEDDEPSKRNNGSYNTTGETISQYKQTNLNNRNYYHLKHKLG